MEFTTVAELSEYPVVIRWPVQWGDQDAFGHVNNTIFFRWFESARIAYMGRLGFSGGEGGQGIGPILAHIGCHFRRQVKFPDTVQIGTRVTRLGRSSMTVVHCIVSESEHAVVADGESTIVVFNYSTQRPSAIPDELRAAITQLEGNSLA
jgi:acyl-CoA thioester hydrolase